MGETPPPPVWTPSLYQSVTTVNGQPVYGDVYLDSTSSVGGITQTNNIYSLNYVTTFTMIEGTFMIENVPPELVSMRKTLIGVIPLISLQSTNKKNDIVFSFPTNNFAISVVRFDRDYTVYPQSSGSAYNTVETSVNSGGSSIALTYRNALVINGIYDALNGFVYGQRQATFRMEMKQAVYTASGVGDDTISYAEKKIVVPITIIKASSSLSIKPFYGAGRYTIPNADINGIITREYLDGKLDLNFSDFAITTRKNVNVGTDDYDNIIYYLKLDGVRSFQFSNDNITISGNRIIFKKVTLNADKITYSPIPIKFLQEETAIYDRSSERIGDSSVSTITIQLNIIKSTPTFVGQIPSINTGISTTIYRLADMNKMTSERSFVITLPGSTNTDPEANFTVRSSDVELLKIVAAGSVYTAFIYGPGVVTVTITQPATTNFNEKSAIFDVNIFNITSSILNCNYNLFYANPYNRNFWTRFKPECRSSNLFDNVNNRMLTGSEVDEVYDMRRKVEILKYNKNVGGLTKSQKYAKASRGELMRKIGNERNYISETIGGITTLVCPPTSANNRLSCGLTTACGVPGKERLLCYDASINLYNYKRTYQYQAGLQVPSNLPTIVLTEPTNLRVKSFDNVNNKVTLEWDAPDSNGGLPIVGYVITFSEDNNKWTPYKSVFPYRPTNAEEAAAASYNKLSGEINGNTVIFERIPDNNVEIRANTIYYISVFSGNERGLSSVPATIIVKTSAVPSIIDNLRFTNSADERQNLMIDLTWSDPINTGSSAGSFIGPSIRQYNLYFRKVPTLTWTKQTLDLSNIIIPSSNAQQRQFILRNLENQNKYDIKIEPINSIGVGPESAIITGRTLMKPSVPLNIIATSKYGLLPTLIINTPRNYINVAWSKPDNGGNPITIYNITITPPTGSSIQPITISYDISNSSTSITSYNLNITRLGQSELISGDYSITMQAFNGYLNSNESAATIVTLRPTSQQPIIQSIIGYYANGLQYADLKFSITKPWVDENTISTVRVLGLSLPYEVFRNINDQPIAGTGDHTIRILALSSNNDFIITVGQIYTQIKITLVFSLTGEERTSDAFSYSPEIRL